MLMAKEITVLDKSNFDTSNWSDMAMNYLDKDYILAEILEVLEKHVQIS